MRASGWWTLISFFPAAAADDVMKGTAEITLAVHYIHVPTTKKGVYYIFSP